MDKESVLQAIPHRPPFLFVDEVVELEEQRIRTRVQADPAAEFFKGHYPDNPVMPGVLLCECCFQAGALLVGHHLKSSDSPRHAGGKLPADFTRHDLRIVAGQGLGGLFHDRARMAMCLRIGEIQLMSSLFESPVEIEQRRPMSAGITRKPCTVGRPHDMDCAGTRHVDMVTGGEGAERTFLVVDRRRH